jgi:hypothetical protein
VGGGIDWFVQGRDRAQWNLRVPQNVEKFLSSWATGRFSSRAQFHGIKLSYASNFVRT